ncbi:MAG: hypothetical protein HC868_12655 [Sphingomonadales bacterium]|nr:hypothetical protein [Sphingomonadales bacterium]
MHDRARAASALADLTARCSDDVELAPLGACLGEPAINALLAGLFGASPYLTELILRNPATINLLDGCSISVPMGRRDGPPCGLMLSAAGGRDRWLFAVASAVEASLSMRT